MIDWPALIARNAPLNAFVDWDRSAHAGVGPLSDLTIGIKANIAVKGLPWTAGMGLYRDRIAERDADVVAALRTAGAAILGSLNMHEAALGATTDNVFYGRTHNPHRHGFTPGGSSGGSGAAVAAGLCDAALGTDTMGSVRIPAAYCGVYGLKPTHGAASQAGLACLEPGLDVIGPLARTLDVLERVWRTLKPLPSPEGEELRIFALPHLAHIETQPAVRAACERMLARLPAATPLTLPHSPSQVRLAGFVASARWLIADLGDRRRTRADGLSPELHFMLDRAKTLDPRPDIIAETRAALADALGQDGILIMPTAPQTAFVHTNRPPANQADFTCLASVAGLPALSIPAGIDQDGLPVGVQIVGPANSEDRLIAFARTVEEDAS